jgi:hypothetical protein
MRQCVENNSLAVRLIWDYIARIGGECGLAQVTKTKWATIDPDDWAVLCIIWNPTLEAGFKIWIEPDNLYLEFFFNP